MKSRKPVYILLILFITSFAVIGMLAFISKNAIAKENGFNRRLLTPALTSGKHISFPVRISKLIGIKSDKIYWQEENPLEIFSTNLSLDSLQTIKLPLPVDKEQGPNIRMYIKDHNLYLACRNVPAIIAYDLDSGSVINYALSNNFNQEALLATDHFILRARDPQLLSHRFVKLDLKNKDSLAEDNFSDRKAVGGFETAGILYYDAVTKQACYTYFYQNGFICMDSNLNVTLKAKTIDTITHRNVKVARVGRSITMKQPAQAINYNGCVADGKLFLQSKLKADNEYELDFNENIMVDIYSLKNGDYKGSFYIPAYEGKKAHQFKVISHQLYALYDKTVVLYDLEFIADLL